jgi:hypothetical protein
MSDSEVKQNGAEEVFHIGMTPSVRIVGFLAAAFALWIPVVILFGPLGDEKSTMSGLEKTLSYIFFIALDLAMIYTARRMLMTWRNAYLEVDKAGLHHENWRGQAIDITWKALRKLVVSEAHNSCEVVIEFADEAGAIRKLGLLQAAQLYDGQRYEVLKEIILKYKQFPTCRESRTWYLSDRYTYE